MRIQRKAQYKFMNAKGAYPVRGKAGCRWKLSMIMRNRLQWENMQVKLQAERDIIQYGSKSQMKRIKTQKGEVW